MLEHRVHADTLYTNLTHELDPLVVAVLEANPDRISAQHAAWEFCGWIWKGEDGLWHEQVWRYQQCVETRSNENLEDLINSVNDDYGRN